jgi:hypothetical protein
MGFPIPISNGMRRAPPVLLAVRKTYAAAVARTLLLSTGVIIDIGTVSVLVTVIGVVGALGWFGGCAGPLRLPVRAAVRVLAPPSDSRSCSRPLPADASYMPRVECIITTKTIQKPLA